MDVSWTVACYGVGKPLTRQIKTTAKNLTGESTMQNRIGKYQTIAAMACLLFALTGCLGSGGSSSPTGSSSGSSITATANTTAQTLAVGTAMASFSPLTPGGGTAPYTFSHFGTLPAGLSLDESTGVVTGTPTTTYTGVDVYFLVKDASKVVADTTSTVHFTVVPAITATATTTAQKLAVGNAMASFSPLTPHDGITPYTYSIASGVLPAGVSLDAATGAVSGTPTATYTAADVVFSVKDANSAVASTTSTVNFLVDPALTAVVDTTAQNLMVGTAIASFTPLTASGGVAPYTYSVTSGTLPAGLTLDANTGVVTGTPSVAYTTANVVFSALDANGVVDNITSTVSFTVAALPAGYVYQGGLTWMPVSATTYTQVAADTYCTTTTINGQTGWRLPTEVEMIGPLYPIKGGLYGSGAMNGQGWTLGKTWSSTIFQGCPVAIDLSAGAYMQVCSTNQYMTCVR
jgi:hypothetical protein